jgi:hypothetical protein
VWRLEHLLCFYLQSCVACKNSLSR